ncbi:DUF6163 family protein [Methylocystis heyeri]|uniref:DUF6163 family protein n=1 Tax=Methylocystis heyeri TaxID=391905 RepID=UPI00113C495E|nr:DUF6163 family protein [Methylocystis heyeri]
MADPMNYDDADDPYKAIRVGDPGGAGEGAKWGRLLTRFMRVMAVFWLLQGLLQWQAILAAKTPIFDAMPQSAALAVILFSVLDLVAGVGLWLATPWGGVLWLLIASAQIFVAASMPRFFAGGYWLIGVNLVLIVLYFALTFEAGRDFETQNMIDRRRRRKGAGQGAPAELGGASEAGAEAPAAPPPASAKGKTAVGSADPARHSPAAAAKGGKLSR